jgi:SpoIID/LytB domain protein
MACCGGHTESALEIWGNDPPGLTAVRDSDRKADFPDREFPLGPWRLKAYVADGPVSWCDQAPLAYRWIKVLNRDELARLGQRYGIGEITDIRIRGRTTHGFVRSVTLAGTLGSKEWRGDRIRTLFGSIKSNLFVVERKKDKDGRIAKLILRGAGFGHGVGMCQEGAGGMARQGYQAEEIVKHYYRGTDVGKCY